MGDRQSDGIQIEGHDVGEYTIAAAKTRDELVKKVNALIEKKWLPIGGLSVASDSAGVAFLQALVRSKYSGSIRVSSLNAD